MAGAATQHKALVAQTVQTAETYRSIDVGDIVDLDSLVGGLRLGDLVNPDHFAPIKAAKDPAPAAPPASAKKSTE